LLLLEVVEEERMEDLGLLEVEEAEGLHTKQVAPSTLDFIR
jgi:hypothetical protein